MVSARSGKESGIKSMFESMLYGNNPPASRFNLAVRVAGDEFDPFAMSNTFDAHIKKPRRKIGDAEGCIFRILRQIGYTIKEESP
jgi:DNA-binding response OmpR family regulator